MEKVIMYEQIYRDLQNAIREKEYKAGERLPSEKELEEKYQVSRITAKKAMDMLADAKYIIRFPGRGSFVNERIADILDTDEPHLPAVSHSGNHRKRIGIIFDTFGCDFGSELLKSLEQECRRKGYDMLFRCTYGSLEEETEAIQAALDLGVDGLILMCAQGEVYNSTILRLSLNHFPMVLVDRQIKGIPIPCVKTDNYSAAKELTEILIQHGHKKICFVTHASINTSTIDERYSGFADCMMQYEDVIGVFAKIENYNPTPEDIEKEYKEYNFKEFLQIIEENEDCTAFLAAEYKMAVLLDRAAKKLCEKREIVAFDGLEPIYDACHDFVYAKQNEYEMGKQAIDTLHAIIEGHKMEENIDIPYELVKVENKEAP